MAGIRERVEHSIMTRQLQSAGRRYACK